MTCEMFIRPMLNTPIQNSTSVAEEFVAKATARVDAGRQANKILWRISWACNEVFPPFTRDDWVRLMLIWESLKVRSRSIPQP